MCYTYLIIWLLLYTPFFLISHKRSYISNGELQLFKWHGHCYMGSGAWSRLVQGHGDGRQWNHAKLHVHVDQLPDNHAEVRRTLPGLRHRRLGRVREHLQLYSLFPNRFATHQGSYHVQRKCHLCRKKTICQPKQFPPGSAIRSHPIVNGILRWRWWNTPRCWCANRISLCCSHRRL